jgi:hypothetical protein
MIYKYDHIIMIIMSHVILLLHTSRSLGCSPAVPAYLGAMPTEVTTTLSYHYDDYTGYHHITMDMEKQAPAAIA